MVRAHAPRPRRLASKERVPATAITYEDLADPKWKGKICSRSGQHTYNVALVAAMIANHGEAKAEEWLKGVKANLARKPSGGDREGCAMSRQDSAISPSATRITWSDAP